MFWICALAYAGPYEFFMEGGEVGGGAEKNVATMVGRQWKTKNKTSTV